MGQVSAGGADIFVKDRGTSRPVVLGRPLGSDSCEAQQLFLAGNGFRVVAHDRRGPGRSGLTWHGNDLDTYADDLAAVLDRLDLRAAGIRDAFRRQGLQSGHRNAYACVAAFWSTVISRSRSGRCRSRRSSWGTRPAGPSPRSCSTTGSARSAWR